MHTSHSGTFDSVTDMRGYSSVFNRAIGSWDKWSSDVLAGNGIIYGVLRSATSVLRID